MRISRLPDNLKLQLKRGKCIVSSFVIWMPDILALLWVKMHDNLQTASAGFQMRDSWGYMGVHRDTSRKCVTATQDAGWLVTLLDALFHKTKIRVLRVRNIKVQRPLKYHGGTIKCSTIAHLAKETRQHKEQWGWGLGLDLHRVRAVRTPLPTMFFS